MTRNLPRNIRYAWRVLARSPGFTLTVVLTLALVIGANGAVFSAIDAVLLKPLPFPDADRLVRLRELRDETGETGVALARLRDWDRLSSTFEAITAYNVGNVATATTELPERTTFAAVTPGFFAVFGAAPTLGRGFTDDEYRLGQSTTVIHSDSFWRTRFGADPTIVGTTVSVEAQSFSTVGVMPASFRFLDREVQSWSAAAVDAPWLQDRRAPQSYWNAVGRLKAGVTLEQAQADLTRVQAELAELYPDTDRELGIRLVPLKQTVVGGVRGSLWLLFGAVSVLLLIACTNVAALLLARATQREREISIRYSLGALRSTVIGQLLVETAMLAIAGAAAGLIVAAGAAAVLRTLAPELPRLDEVAMSSRIVLYTLAAAVVVTLLCGLIPALRGARVARMASSRGQVSSRHAWQWGLVGVQVALSVTLLAGAGLLVRSFDALARVDAGFEPTRVLAFRVARNTNEWNDYDRVVQRINRRLDELATLPGIEAAAASGFLVPGVATESPAEFQVVEGEGAGDPVIAASRFVSPSYFETLQVPLLAGELCRRPSSQAERQAGLEAMVNRSFADRYFPGRSVLGLQLRSEGAAAARIVGIVGDARELGLDRNPVATVYACDSAMTPFGAFLVRTIGDPVSVVSSVRQKINELEPLEAVYDVVPLVERIAGAQAQNRLRMILLGLFAGAAISLACVGVYGTLNYVVSVRRREVGLRVALGAVSRNIVSEFLLKALRVVGVACAVGLVLSLAFGRALQGMLYEVSPSDPITLAGVLLIVVAVATFAAFLPALRASRIDPMKALREE